MKTIKVLGPGCARCKTTETHVREALAQTGIQAEVIKIEDIQEIMTYDILRTPGLVIDGVVKVSGRVPSVEEIKEMLA